MTTGKQCHQIWLNGDLSSALESFEGASGSSRSALVAEALCVWLAQREGAKPGQQSLLRLERIGRKQARIEEKLFLIAEVVGAFIQHQLTLNANHSEFTPEAVCLGERRYRAFVDAVARRLTCAAGSQPIGAAPDGDGISPDKDNRHA